LVEDKPFSAVIHFLHNLLLSADDIIRLLLVYMTLKVVFVIWFPRFRTHIAKGFATGASHKIASHRSLHSFFAPRADFCILCNPFSIGFFLHYLLHPLHLLLALASIVIVALTAEAKYFAACTADCIELHVDLYAISAINPCAKLIVLISCYELLANFLLIFFEPNLSFLSIQGKHP
jgi:hypothetical protein